MNRTFVLLLLLLLAGCPSGKTTRPGYPAPVANNSWKGSVPAEVAALRDSPTLTLYAIEEPPERSRTSPPAPSTSATFQGYLVLRKVEVSGPDQAEVLDALEASIRAQPRDRIPACFWPHHAIEGGPDGSVSFVICFLCARIRTHSSFGEGGTGSPRTAP